VAQVAGMVAQEQGRSQAAETVAAAEGLVHANAEALLRRIVAHFQHLFAVEHLEGILPAMNQVAHLSRVTAVVVTAMDRLSGCSVSVRWRFRLFS
jgi:hypothetical protein